MYIKAWNNFKIDNTGKLIIGYYIKEAGSVTEALDIAEKEARAWNKRHKKNVDSIVNFVTCEGFIRVIN